MILELTQIDGSKVLVNMMNALAVEPIMKDKLPIGAKVVFNNYSIMVKQSVKQIRYLINSEPYNDDMN